MSDQSLTEMAMEVVNVGADPEVLRDAAAAWTELGSAVDRVLADVQRKIRALEGSWEGESDEAFRRQWAARLKPLEAFHEECSKQAKQLNSNADDLEESIKELHDLYAEIGVFIGVGAALGVFTMGISTVATSARVIAISVRVTAIIGRLGAALARAASAMRSHASAFEQMVIVWGKTSPWAAPTIGSVGNMIFNTAVDASDGDGEVHTTKNVLISVVAGVPGGFVGSMAANFLVKKTAWKMTSFIGGGVAGNSFGGLILDGAQYMKPDFFFTTEKEVRGKFWSNVAANIIAGGLTGGLVGKLIKLPPPAALKPPPDAAHLFSPTKPPVPDVQPIPQQPKPLIEEFTPGPPQILSTKPLVQSFDPPPGKVIPPAPAPNPIHPAAETNFVVTGNAGGTELGPPLTDIGKAVRDQFSEPEEDPKKPSS